MQDLLIAIAAPGVFLLLFELLANKTSLPSVVSRKLLHVGMALCVVSVSSGISYRYFAVAGVVFFGLLMVLRWKRPLYSLAYRAKVSYGDIFFPLGVGVAAVLAEDTAAFAVAIAVLGLADTAAFIAGKMTPGPRLYRTKTLGGWIACAAVTGVLFVIAGHGWGVVVAGSLAVALTELFSARGSDNLTIPLACVLLLAVLA